MLSAQSAEGMKSCPFLTPLTSPLRRGLSASGVRRVFPDGAVFLNAATNHA